MRIVFLNPQGNFNQTDAFWTEHPDFGGQLVYVKEIALSLAKLGHQVDILTRKFKDEYLNLFDQTFDQYQGEENVRIVRIKCGPEGFLKKEDLWEYLSEWVENIIEFYKNEGIHIDFITSHYGDGGIAGAMLSKKIDVPFSFTGHSLGAQKMDKLKANEENINVLIQQYKFGKRLLAERTAMRYASLIFVSTRQEKEEQYTHIAYDDVSKINKEQRFIIAPPGANLDVFSYQNPNKNESTYYHKLDAFIKRDIFPKRQALPYIVSASRLDPKKNHIGFLRAYAQSNKLQSICNVAISLRGVDNAFDTYDQLKQNEKIIMNDLMAVIKEYHLEGKVTFINITSQEYLASAYRYFQKRRSIFTLTALYEPFGLAPIEAMAAGLPVAVTKYGGPSEVLFDDNQTYGVLLDVKNTDQMIKGYLDVFEQYDRYKHLGLQRVNQKYNWLSTAQTYVDAIQSTLSHPINLDIQIPTYFTNPRHNINELSIIQSHYFKKEE